MADFNNLALTVSGIKALLAAQAGTTLTLTKIGMGSGSTDNFTGLTNLVTPEAMLPITEKKIDEDSHFLSIVAKMTNESVTKGFYWRETGLFFEDSEGNDVLFAYACVKNEQYDYVPAYSDKRYVKHVRIANIIADSDNIVVNENEGLLYVDTLTFEEYQEFIAEEFEKTKRLPVNNNLLVNSNFANPVNQRGETSLDFGSNKNWIDRWRKYANVAVSIGDGCVNISRGAETSNISLVQTVESNLLGKTVTFSVKLLGYDDVVSVTAKIPETYSTEQATMIAESAYVNNVRASIYQIPDGLVRVQIIPIANSTVSVEWAKLELGNYATQYVALNHYDEWLRCGFPDDTSIFGYKKNISPVNNNLIINSNFANPVNQRGNTSMDIGVKGYWIDRWTKGSNISCAVRSGYIELGRKTATSDITLYHYLEESLLGKTVTFSVKLYGGDVLVATTTIPNSYSDIEVAKLIKNVVGNGVSINIGLNYKGKTYLGISPHENSTVKIEWAKLELGDHATPYVPRLYQEEFNLCLAYYQTLTMVDAGLSISGSEISFMKEISNYMRVTPSIGVPFNETLKVRTNNTDQSGFTFSLVFAAPGYIAIRATKSNHGLDFSKNPLAYGHIVLDAEL